MLFNLSGVKYHFVVEELVLPDVFWLETCDGADWGDGAGVGGSNCEDEECIPLEVLVLEDTGGYGGFG